MSSSRGVVSGTAKDLISGYERRRVGGRVKPAILQAVLHLSPEVRVLADLLDKSHLLLVSFLSFQTIFRRQTTRSQEVRPLLRSNLHAGSPERLPQGWVVTMRDQGRRGPPG